MKPQPPARRNVFDETREHLAKDTKTEYRCRFCDETAAYETLSNFGGRCGRCFANYCRTSMPPRVDNGDKRKSLLDWAHVLKRRHERGDLLTPGQINAYQGALKLRTGPAQALPFD